MKRSAQAGCSTIICSLLFQLREQQAFLESKLTAWEVARASWKNKEHSIDSSAIDIDEEVVHSEKLVKDTTTELDEIDR